MFKKNDTTAFKRRTIILPSGERVHRVIRPEFRAMLKYLADGQTQLMSAYDLERTVRDPRDLEDLIDAKVLGGLSVCSVTDSMRPDTDLDMPKARMLVAMTCLSSRHCTTRHPRPSAVPV